jgi:hypothetical protein
LNEVEEIEEEEAKEDVEMQLNLTRLIGDQKFREKLMLLKLRVLMVMKIEIVFYTFFLLIMKLL